MKLYIWFLSFLLTFAPIYQANAILPLGAFAVSQTGRLAVQTAGGVILKKPSSSAVAKMAKATLGICLQKALNTALCTALVAAIKNDKWNIEIENNDTTNNDIDVNIYKQESPTDECKPTIYYVSGSYKTSSIDLISNKSINRFYDKSGAISVARQQLISADGKDYGYVFLNNESNADNSIKDSFDIEKLQRSGVCSQISVGQYYYTNVYLGGYTLASKATTNRSSANAYLVYEKISYPAYKQHITEQEINNYYNNYKTDNDFINNYNYDYTQHIKIEINNESESGDTINKTIKNDVDNNETEKKVTDNAAKKIKDKDSDYDIDNINDENCDKDDTGAYDKCGADRDNDDDTASTPASTPTPTDPPKDDDDDSPIECNSNRFYKKVCDWMDWTQDEPTKPTDEKPPIKDIDAENSNKIDMSGSCPAPYQINFSVFGHSQNNSISYQPLCDALEMLKPIFVGAGALSSMFILMGYSRPNSTGVND